MTHPGTKPPNVLFLFTDDQRFDALGAAGNPEIHTPHLDALCRRGVLCGAAHIPGGTVPAVCMPSRAMLHTGRGLFELARSGEFIPDDHVTLGEAFRAAGYATFGTGKWHNGTESFARGFTDGGEIFFGGMDDHWNVPAARFDPSGAYAARLPTIRDPLGGKVQQDRIGDHIHAGHHSTDLFTDATLAFLERRPKVQPFFAYTSLMAPHDPRVMPQRFLDLYDVDAIRLPKNFQHHHPYDTGFLKGRDEILASFPRQAAEIKEHIRDYYAMISHIDEAVGRLMERLAAEDLLGSTLIIFAGDNGLAVGQHGLMGKQNLYDHSVRVPLLVAGPGIPRGQRWEGLCTLSDVFPTLCTLCRLDAPASMTSFDLSPGILRHAPSPRRDLYLAYAGTIRGVTNQAHKLIEYADGGTQLFDLRSDPDERCNLVGRPESRDLLHGLRERLLSGRSETNETHCPEAGDFWERRPDLLHLTN